MKKLRPIDLRLDLLPQRREQVADVERQVLVGQVLSAEVARVEELEQELHDVEDLDARGQEATVDVLRPRIAAIARQDPLDEAGQRRRGGHALAGEADIVSTSAKRPS
jgi:hypothetical protein